MEGKRVWSKEETFALISAFEEFPELWQIKAKIYRDRVKKQKAVKAIADKFDTTEAEIQRKLHNLRTQTNQEWKKIQQRKSGQGTDEIYKSSWEYFEALKFLIDPNSVTVTEDNLNLPEIMINPDLQEPADTTPTTADKKNNKRKRSCIDDETIQKAMTELNKPSDEFDVFGDYVASELRSLQFDHHKRKLKRLIQKAILDISEMDENERSSSALSTHSQTSNNSRDSEASIYSVYSPPSTIQPMQSHSQPSHRYSVPHSSNYQSSQYEQTEPPSEPHNIQELSLRSYIQGYETST